VALAPFICLLLLSLSCFSQAGFSAGNIFKPLITLMKLWEKETSNTTAKTEQFTVGRDREFDLLLARYDVCGSLAHTAMLESVGLLSADAYAAVKGGLEAILEEIEQGTFTIDESVEDIHSQIELLLTQRIGEDGKKIHSGRSRNDQVAVDIKLYLRDALKDTGRQAGTLIAMLLELSNQHKAVLMPGYTHLQIAMPSSFGLWFAAYAECLAEDLEMLAGAYAVVNKNPLGSGAGYGSSLPLDRTMTTSSLGFNSMHYNAIAAQMSRGRAEKMVAMGISCIAATLARMAMDICLYNSQNFGFIRFPESLTTGSSIMPHKKNPDIFELIRGKCNRLQALPNELSLLLTNLPSGYHRELQLTKEILFPAIQVLHDCMDMLLTTLPHAMLNEHILDDPKYQYLFSVEAVNKLVNEGIPFRDAYRQVGKDIASGSFHYEGFDVSQHTHEGSIGNLCNDQIRAQWLQVAQKLEL
jgi:argininosuccinate lyase